MRPILVSVILVSLAALHSSAPVRRQKPRDLKPLNDNIGYYLDRIPYGRTAADLFKYQTDFLLGQPLRTTIRGVSTVGSYLGHLLENIPTFGLEVNEENIKKFKFNLIEYVSKVPFAGEYLASMVRSVPARTLMIGEVKMAISDYIKQVSVLKLFIDCEHWVHSIRATSPKHPNIYTSMFG